MTKRLFSSSVGISLCFAVIGAAVAEAQEEAPPEPILGEPEPAPQPQPEPQPMPMPPPQAQPAPPPQPVAESGRVDGVRFRGGVGFTVGLEGVPDADFTATMFGVDWRLGVQINHLVGIYGAGHLSFGSAEVGFGGTGSTGTFAGHLMADFTLQDIFFAGAGVGYTVFNNPSGPSLAIRVGAYPVKSAPSDRARRKGLALSLETRLVFLEDPFGTGYQIMGAVGYEAF